MTAAAADTNLICVFGTYLHISRFNGTKSDYKLLDMYISVYSQTFTFLFSGSLVLFRFVRQLKKILLIFICRTFGFLKLEEGCGRCCCCRFEGGRARTKPLAANFGRFYIEHAFLFICLLVLGKSNFGRQG